MKISTDIKKTIAVALAVMLSVFAVDRIGGYLMHWVFTRSCDVATPKIRHIQTESDADVLFLGTSRCNVHFVPDIIEDSLGTSVYNEGVDGSSNIYSHYFVLSTILSYHKPKMICLGVDVFDYIEEELPFETIGFFAPLIGESEAADSVFMEAGTYNAYQISHLYRYNSKALEMLSGMTFGIRAQQEKGYMQRPAPAVFPVLDTAMMADVKIDTLKVEYLGRFVQKCKTAGIPLVFIVSPKLTVCGSEYVWLEEYCEHHEVPLLNYHSRGLFHDNPQNFYDKAHLWDKGARELSAIVAHDIKQLGLLDEKK